MNQKEFTAMIQQDDYHFFVFSCPAITPLNFALHTRIVVVSPWKIDRRELGHFRNSSLKYLHKNLLQPRWWINKYLWKTHSRFESRLLYHCSGKSDSLAYKIVSRISNNVENYPYRNEYRLVWHNSNFFTQWILDQLPEINYKLPRNALGK